VLVLIVFDMNPLFIGAGAMTARPSSRAARYVPPLCDELSLATCQASGEPVAPLCNGASRVGMAARPLWRDPQAGDPGFCPQWGKTKNCWVHPGSPPVPTNRFNLTRINGKFPLYS
jgi:hypothetical protein